MNARKRILFVDDEPNVIDALRRMLRKQRDEWDMEFVTSGRAALERMKLAPFHVMVTDLRMPDMNGAELLEQVVEKYPDTVRIVLSGHADEDMITRAMRLAHQFLWKPTDAEVLKAAVTRSLSTSSVLHDPRIRAAVARCDTLPTLPTLYVELTRAIESATSDARQIAAIISRDMAVSAKILQLVNSSFFGLGRRVSSIEQTVSLLGVNRIRGLVLTESIVRQFKPPSNLKQFSTGAFWEHAALVAEVARCISRAEGQQGDRPDQAFTAGLLHDIGKLIFASQHTKVYAEILEESAETGEPVCQIEMRRLNVTHAEVGAYLLGLWALPSRITEAIALHHEPSRIPYNGLCAVTAVHVANVLSHAQCAVTPAEQEAHLAALDTAYLERIGLAGRVPAWTKLAGDALARRQAAAV